MHWKQYSFPDEPMRTFARLKGKMKFLIQPSKYFVQFGIWGKYAPFLSLFSLGYLKTSVSGFFPAKAMFE